MANGSQELFSLLVSDIKNYKGEDPLRPWLHGIRRMRESLPPHLLKEKLPRFLQKCAQTFESDRRYRNDSRYLRVWIQLMDYVDDARTVLKRMEKNRIGMKRAVFYSAYALYYEKRKKFEEAEKMYHLGVQNLAEPVDELPKSYEQFLHRMELSKKRKAKLKEATSTTGRPTANSIPFHQGMSKTTNNSRMVEGVGGGCHMGGGSASHISHHNIQHNHKNVGDVNLMEGCSKFVEGGFRNSTNSMDLPKEKSDFNVQIASTNLQNDVSSYDVSGTTSAKRFFRHRGNADRDLNKQTSFCRDDTVFVKFVDSAIVGKSEAEDACHHGLVDPTVNMKEAMNAINSMFREPLEPEPMARRRMHRSKPKTNQQTSSFEVFIDESFCDQRPENGVQNGYKNAPHIQSSEHRPVTNPVSSKKQMETVIQKPFVEAFKILADDDDDDGVDSENKKCLEGSKQPARSVNSYLGSYDDPDITSSGDVRLKEDTVIRRIVRSTVFDDSEVENACHHGLVDPTINMKEAMDDINSMFGKPLNFIRANKPKKQGEVFNQKPASHEFSILADDNLEEDPKRQVSSSNSCNAGREFDLCEPTIFTKEAMAEINEMFGKPLDF